MSHYTMLYEYGKRTRDFWERFLFFLKFSSLYFWGVFKGAVSRLNGLKNLA